MVTILLRGYNYWFYSNYDEQAIKQFEETFENKKAIWGGHPTRAFVKWVVETQDQRVRLN